MNAARSCCRLLGLAALVLSGCAKAPSVIDVQITADDTVPEVTLLQSTVVLLSDPSRTSVLSWVSGGGGDPDSGRPGGFPFPLLLHVRVPPSWNGPVSLTIEGLDFDTEKVIATGTTEAAVSSEQTTTASLTLRGVVIGGAGGDGGTGDGGSDSGGPDAGVATDDAGAPDAAD